MSNYGAVEAVLQALQRSDAIRGDPLPAAPLPKPEPSIHLNPPQQDSSEKPSAGGKDSLIKARFAATVLRVAQSADRQTAARLVRGLARDAPLPNELPELADIHLDAIAIFVRLAAGLADGTNASQQHLWNAAQDATKHWLATLNAPQ
jgi:hypothetical protein